MVGKVRFGTISAAVEPPAQRGGRAPKVAPPPPGNGSGGLFAGGSGGVRPVRREDVGQSEGHGFFLRYTPGKVARAALAFSSLTSVRCRYTMVGLRLLCPR